MRHLFSLATALAVLFSSPSSSWAGDWEQFIDESGIRVWQREVPGTSLVEFRGRGRVNASMVKISAVIRNSGREKEWMESCAESFVLQWKTPIHAVVYHRLASPNFFISDRDMVAEATTTVVPADRALRVDFKGVEHAKAPPVDDAVRVPKLIGHWQLVAIDEHTTEVEYQVQADPGGSLPHFLVNWASRKVPFHTIEKLRDQVKKDGYDDDIMILERSIDWTALSPPTELSLKDR